MTSYEVYEKVIEKMGKVNQVIKSVEEMSELTTELIKYALGDGFIHNLRGICDEIADVEIMLAQLKIIFDKDNTIVPMVKEYKIKRLRIMKLDREPETRL